jgi:hypothetical protein
MITLFSTPLSADREQSTSPENSFRNRERGPRGDNLAATKLDMQEMSSVA